MNELETQVVNYLTKWNNVYTKTLYKALHVKQQYNMSLNEFRRNLFKLQEQGVIEQSGDILPYWNVK